MFADRKINPKNVEISVYKWDHKMGTYLMEQKINGMTKKEVAKSIFELISPRIKAFDFTLDIKKEMFIRNTPDAIFMYDLLFYTQKNIRTGETGYQVEPFIWINVKEIELFYKEITINNELKNESDFKTLGESVAEVIANPDGEHKKWNQSLELFVFDESDIRSVGKELVKQFEKVALPYYLKNGNVSMVDRLFNADPRKRTVHMSNDLYRIIKGIIAAKLVNNPELDSLVITYDTLLTERDMPEDCREEMNRLKAILPMIGKKLNI